MNRSAAQTLIAGKRERLCTRVYLEDGTLLFLDVMFAPRPHGQVLAHPPRIGIKTASIWRMLNERVKDD